MEEENAKLKKLVTNRSLNNAILKDRKNLSHTIVRKQIAHLPERQMIHRA